MCLAAFFSETIKFPMDPSDAEARDRPFASWLRVALCRETGEAVMPLTCKTMRGASDKARSP